MVVDRDGASVAEKEHAGFVVVWRKTGHDASTAIAQTVVHVVDQIHHLRTDSESQLVVAQEAVAQLLRFGIGQVTFQGVGERGAVG